MSFDVSKANSAMLHRSPWAMCPSWGTFASVLHPLFSYEYIQARREETSSLQCSAGVDVHNNRTWQDVSALTRNSCDTKSHVLYTSKSLLDCVILLHLQHILSPSSPYESWIWPAPFLFHGNWLIMRQWWCRGCPHCKITCIPSYTNLLF